MKEILLPPLVTILFLVFVLAFVWLAVVATRIHQALRDIANKLPETTP